MNKIKQNKITFTLIFSIILIIFASITILSLPVLFNYKSKVALIEKNFYKNFKIYLKSSDNISYKPFPKPHLLVENASLNLTNNNGKNDLVETTNLKIFVTLREIYLRSFNNFISTEISDSNIELQLPELKEIRKHLYLKVNKPIIFNNCKIFIKNEKKEVILISPLDKISYKINSESKFKNLIMNGEVFGLKFKSEWKRNYKDPNTTLHNVNIYNPNIEIRNVSKFENKQKFKTQSEIAYSQDKLEYNLEYENGIINITSPDRKQINYNINSKIQFKPFYFDGILKIKNKKIENIIDNFLIYLFLYNEDYLGNLNGLLKIKFDELNNKLIKNGEINLIVNEQKINLKEAYFQLDKVGEISSSISFLEKNEEIKFISKNELIIKNHIEFAKIFQVGSKKIKNIKKIYFDLEKSVGSKDFILKNIKLNDVSDDRKSNEIFIVRNIQNLRSHIRKIID